MNIAGTTFFALMYLVFTAGIVTGKSETASAGCRLLPRNTGDVLSFVFHSLELIVFNGLLLLLYGISLLQGDSAFAWFVLATGVSSALLVVLSLVFWNHDRSLSDTGLLWGVPVAGAYVLIMARL